MIRLLPDEEVIQIEVQKGWEMYFAGASRSPNGEKQSDPKKAGIGIVFLTPDKAIIPYSFALTEECSNNEAEYESVIAERRVSLTDPD